MDLATGKLSSIYRKFLISAIGSAIISSIYISVDMIAVGQSTGPIGAAAFSCINPIYSIMIALGLLFGIGGSVLMGNALGAGKKQEANEFFTVTVVTAIVVSAVLLIGVGIALEPLLRLFGADDELLPYSVAYAKWIVIAIPLFILGVSLSAFIRNDGAPGLCAISTCIGGGLNMVLDYILVFLFDMDMSGAGLATMIGQLTMLIVLLTHFFSKKCTLRFVKPTNALAKLRAVATVGLSPCLVDLANGVSIAVFNNQIMRLASSVELAVFCTVSNVVILFQSLFYGVGQCIQPAVSVNFGAKQYPRVKWMLRAAMITAGVMGVLFCGACELFPEFFLRLYMDVTDEVLAVGPQILRIYATCILFMGFGVVSIYYLQSILRSTQSVVLSLLRGFVLCVILMLILPALFGFNAIWLTMPLSELITLGVAAVFLKRSNGAMKA